MAVTFRQVRFPPLQELTAEAPDGAIIGIVSEKGHGASELARVAARLEQPVSGEVISNGAYRYLGSQEALNLAPVELLIIDHSFSQADALVRARAAVSLDRLRANGATILLLSHEPALLRELCDEIWWLEAGTLWARGDPRETLEAYQGYIAGKFRAWGETLSVPLTPGLRKGDGRAEIVAIETLGASGKPSMTLHSGEQATVRVVIRFMQDVNDPVVGIMIRTRIGLEVYGTNTELEKVNLGRCAAGETVSVGFHFVCALCPKEYTLTAASHDPDGTAHDWLDDAVAFVVADSRFTAGVADLRASITVERGK